MVRPCAFVYVNIDHVIMTHTHATKHKPTGYGWCSDLISLSVTQMSCRNSCSDFSGTGEEDGRPRINQTQ